ncbi:MAG: DUF2459 domain-containing protein [bacterium]
MNSHLIAGKSIVIIFNLALFMTTSCAHVSPPDTVKGPATKMYLVDYGIHSSIVMNTGTSDQWIEYLYGDWNYMVEGHDNYAYGIFTLTVPTWAALGRRALARPVTSNRQLKKDLNAENVYRFRVSREKVNRLHNHLKAMFEKRKDQIQPGRYFASMEYVPHPRSYHLLNTCNGTLDSWLESTGTQVQGTMLISKYTIEQGADQKRK